MARFAIAGLRPGETLHAPFGQFATSETDGGVRLTDDQRSRLEAAGYTLIALADEAPAKEPSVEERKAAANAAQTIAANQEAAQKASDVARRVPRARKQ